MNKFRDCTVTIYLDGFDVDTEIETARDTITAIEDLVARFEGEPKENGAPAENLKEVPSDFSSMGPPDHPMHKCRDTMPGVNPERFGLYWPEPGRIDEVHKALDAIKDAGSHMEITGEDRLSQICAIVKPFIESAQARRPPRYGEMDQ